MADMNKVWHGTLVYMKSDRTNPPPHLFIQDLRGLGLTPAEKQDLINRVKGWPGGNPQIRQLTINDINQA